MFSDDIPGELKDTAARLAEALRADLAPEAAERHKSLLRAAAGGADVRMLRRGPKSTSRPKPGRKWGVLALAAAMVLGSSALAFAADGAVPGDALYGLDRAVERVGLAMARTPQARAKEHLALAAERLSEIAALESRHDDTHMAGTAEDVTENDQEALDASKDFDALHAHVLAMIAKHTARLAEVRDRLEASGKASQNALDALGRAIGNGDKAAGKVQHGRMEHQPGATSEPGESPDATQAPGKSGEHRNDAGKGSTGPQSSGGQSASGRSGGTGTGSGDHGNGGSSGQPGEGHGSSPDRTPPAGQLD